MSCSYRPDVNSADQLAATVSPRQALRDVTAVLSKTSQLGITQDSAPKPEPRDSSRDGHSSGPLCHIEHPKNVIVTETLAPQVAEDLTFHHRRLTADGQGAAKWR